MMDHHKPAADAIAVVITGGSLIGWLPSVATVLAIIWWLIRIYETSTVQRWLGKADKH